MAIVDYSGIRTSWSSTDPNINDSRGAAYNLLTVERFQCPGSGTQNVDQIGAWMNGGFTAPLRFTILTDVAGVPGTVISNATTVEQTSVSSVDNHFHYVTKPQLTGGDYYWLGVWSGGEYDAIEASYSSGIGRYCASTYSSTGDPPLAAWTTASYLSAIQALVSAAGGLSIPVAAHYYRQQQ